MLYLILLIILGIHMLYQYKTCDDLDIHILPFPGHLLEKACQLKQPLSFPYPHALELNLEEYGPYEISIGTKSIPFKDIPKKYVSLHNQEFLQETRLFRNYESIDHELRPYLCATKEYNLALGTLASPLQQHTHDRTYLYGIEKPSVIRICTPMHSKYIHDNVDIWNLKDTSKIKYREIVLQPTEVLYLPAYWWYSIQFNDSKVAVFQYRTWMNLLSTLPQRLISMCNI